jgi:DNA processing protein
MGDALYPPLLAQTADAPPVLWALGDAALLLRPAIALVGARNASSLGTRMARALADGLGTAGQVVVSGLARGIDAAAHRAAMATGTIAVMAGGVDVIYPSENAALAADIAASGLRISEQPIGLDPQARHFPLRNRIISGLARAVVVVEAAPGSGSLITARAALEQGRDVFAVPGHPFDGRAGGCNALIRDGATLVRGAADVIAALCDPAQIAQDADQPPAAAPSPVTSIPRPPAPAPRSLAETSALHSRILDRLGPSAVAEDQLIRDIGHPASVVAPALLTLELDGRIARQAGGLLARVS